ncbi:hypothetical protein mRhiFer1_009095 [Rhinolophus ferrumequinum]|uniref:Uncharacterized protein n=1 Tax=Rhinolophus ferrumequinum TaxID=59479 RepID=A0A7J7SXP2_RHIFE|nr:hypothetical protein mRhiFer1_009095 [Rhinolophus ferrumequinum]
MSNLWKERYLSLLSTVRSTGKDRPRRSFEWEKQEKAALPGCLRSQQDACPHVLSQLWSSSCDSNPCALAPWSHMADGTCDTFSVGRNWISGDVCTPAAGWAIITALSPQKQHRGGGCLACSRASCSLWPRSPPHFLGPLLMVHATTAPMVLHVHEAQPTRHQRN